MKKNKYDIFNKEYEKLKELEKKIGHYNTTPNNSDVNFSTDWSMTHVFNNSKNNK